MRRPRPINEVKSSQRNRRLRRARALAKFISHCELSLSPVPEKETRLEARYRVLQDLAVRIRLIEEANILRDLGIPDDCDDRQFWSLKQRLPDLIADTGRDLRAERHDW